MWVRVAITFLLLLLPTALHAQAEKRIALLIGNKDYKAGAGALTNPLNDIRIVGEALKGVGFEVLSNDYIRCSWFAGNDQNLADFREEQLELATP
jgi:hypothetical protein